MKYIIEIEDEPLVRRSTLHGEDAVYRASGFKSLVFDQEGLDKLKRYDENVSDSFHVIDNLTGKEADTWEIALKEDWAKSLIYCDMEGFAIEEDGTLILMDECGRHVYCPEGRFKVVWENN